jgi:hypothetical protein
MARQGGWRGFVYALAILATFSGAKLVNAVGYYNMPGDFCQWTGHGFSGGYHAPLVLGPVRFDGAVFPNVTRVSQSPNPYGCVPYCGYEAGYGGDNSGATVMPMAPAAAPAR